jgi:hypothetical protein
MAEYRRRKCRYCGQLYTPDPRNRHHQKYCSQDNCRKASKAESQRRWRASPKGRHYFRGPIQVRRVKAWREANAARLSEYRKTRRKRPCALQDLCAQQLIIPPVDAHNLTKGALQDVLIAQGFVLTGVVAQLTGSALQDDIDSAFRQLILLGRQMQGPGGRRRADVRGQTSPVPTAPAAGAPAVQLDRPSSGSP